MVDKNLEAKTIEVRPEVGESTLIQVGSFSTMGLDIGMGAYSRLDVYKKIRRNPTVALARAVSDAPIQSADWSISTEDDVPEEIELFVKKQLEYVWPMFIKHTLRAREYGSQVFEKVWDVVDGKYVYRKLKPLAQNKTTMLIDPRTGAFLGVRQQNVTLPPEKVFVFTYDAEPGDFYGTSIYENIREAAWIPWTKIAAQIIKYGGKIAGVIPIVKYPIGESKDATGATKSNFEIASAVLQTLGQGNGVAMPVQFHEWAMDLARSGVDPEKLLAWQISFLETKGNHGIQYVNMMKQFEALMLRGLLVPERAAVEGTFGTKAEASTHGDLALAIADLFLDDIILAVNWYLVNPLVTYNFGLEYANKIKVVKSGLDPAKQLFFRKIVETVLTDPNNIKLFQTWVDVDAMLDGADLPKAKENVSKIKIPPNEEETEMTMSKRAFRIYEKLQKV